MNKNLITKLVLFACAAFLLVACISSILIAKTAENYVITVAIITISLVFLMLNKLYLILRAKAVELDREVESTIDFGKLMDEVCDRKGVIPAIWMAVNYLYF